MTTPAGQSFGHRTLVDRLADGNALLAGWSMIASAHVAGLVAAGGFDAVILDMQHGAHDEASVFDGIAAVRRAGAAAVVRVPVGRFDTGSRALDFGADALIAPMINSADDARQFASFSKYPPMGERSWGPSRAMELAGADDATAFLRSQNGATMALAMIETREALAALDDILAIEGIDGVFVGPSDLSIALNRGAAVDPLGSQAVEASAHIAKTARAAGKCAGIYSVSPSWVKTYADQGFTLINIQQDSAYLAHGIRAIVDVARS